MVIGGFDYKAVAYDFKEQAEDLLPEDLNKEQKQFLLETIENFSSLAGEALYNDDSLCLNKEQAICIVQLIAEWTYHKVIDLCHSNIPEGYWNDILEKIAFTIFEVSKQGLVRNIQQEHLIQAVEYQVVKFWKKYINELQDACVLSKEEAKQAKNLSNIDDVSKIQTKTIMSNEENQEDDKNVRISSLDTKGNMQTSDEKINFEKNEFAQKLEKTYNNSYETQNCWISDSKNIKNLFLVAKYGTVICLACCITYILFLVGSKIILFNSIMPIVTKFFVGCKILLKVALIGIFVLAGFFCIKKKRNELKIKKLLDELEKIKQTMDDLTNPNKMYERLGVDEISIEVGQGLIQIADPEQEGSLLARMRALRQKLTDELGYIIPRIRTIDSTNLDNFEYSILIRGNEVGNGYVYPNKVMVEAEDWYKSNKEIPDFAIVGVNPVLQTQAYWIDSVFYEETVHSDEIKCKIPEEVIIAHLKELLIRHVDMIMSMSNVTKLINYVNDKQPELFIDIQTNGITKYDLQKIFVNLIKEKVAINDITYIFERIAEFSKTLKKPEEISEKLRIALKYQIISSNTEEDKILYALTLSEDISKMLSESIRETETGKKFILNQEKTASLFWSVDMYLLRAHNQLGVQPVILCNSDIRLPLYKFLIKQIPTIVVISYDELVNEILLNEVNVIYL